MLCSVIVRQNSPSHAHRLLAVQRHNFLCAHEGVRHHLGVGCVGQAMNRAEVQPALQLDAPHGGQEGESLGNNGMGGPAAFCTPFAVQQQFSWGTMRAGNHSAAEHAQMLEPPLPPHVQGEDSIRGQLEQRPLSQALRDEQLHSPHGPHRIQDQERCHV